jgi:hypothetical protein
MFLDELLQAKNVLHTDGSGRTLTQFHQKLINNTRFAPVNMKKGKKIVDMITLHYMVSFL